MCNEWQEEIAWEEFTRGVAHLMGMPPSHAEAFVALMRPREQRDRNFSALDNQLFPAMSVVQRQQYIRLAHRLES